jgi:hypothetical protein
MAYAAALLLALAGAPLACAPDAGAADVPAVDLLRLFDRAERRPLEGRFDLQEHTFAGVARASLAVPGQSRVTWTVYIPHRARLRVFVSLRDDREAEIAIRVGVSDRRVYNTVAEPLITSAEAARSWIPVDADLSAYAGRKWSVFYRPDERMWDVIIGTHVRSGQVGAVYLGDPALMTDTEGAREYVRRVAERP